MKTLHSPLFFLLILVCCFGCSDDDDCQPHLDENGLTREITDLVPGEIIDEMLRLGLPINGGGNPPAVSGSYLASPLILESSNRPGDQPGTLFTDYEVKFSGQNTDDLSIMIDYVSGSESGTGLGSFIVGAGRQFSIFVEIQGSNSGTTAQFINVISGTMTDDGIEDFYLANFMIDNNGNPGNVWIENGQGRVLFDSDGFSERQ